MALGPVAPGTTPVREDQRRLLKPDYAWIQRQADLNAAEAENIRRYLDWASTARPRARERILTDNYLQTVNRRMFGDVWKWAGTYRRHDLENEFASPWIRIAEDKLNVWRDLQVLRDVTPQEFAIRMHHRIVRVHPFVDGNGRTSRAIADFVMTRVSKLPALTWGSRELRTAGAGRDDYILAMQQADRGDYTALMRFCAS